MTGRHKDEAWLKLIREMPCCICRNEIETEACHIKMADARFGKRIAGHRREDDHFVLPMCSRCHRQQHSGPERAFYEKHQIDAPALAVSMYLRRGEGYLGVLEIMRRILGWQ